MLQNAAHKLLPWHQQYLWHTVNICQVVGRVHADQSTVHFSSSHSNASSDTRFWDCQINTTTLLPQPVMLEMIAASTNLCLEHSAASARIMYDSHACTPFLLQGIQCPELLCSLNVQTGRALVHSLVGRTEIQNQGAMTGESEQ